LLVNQRLSRVLREAHLSQIQKLTHNSCPTEGILLLRITLMLELLSWKIVVKYPVKNLTVMGQEEIICLNLNHGEAK
jgi:hypothetical protein